MDKKNLLLKLAKMILSFAKVSTDKAELVYDGELAEGVEVFVEVEGEMKPAEDGEYISEKQKLIVKDGKIESIEDIEDEKPEDEPKAEDEKPEDENLEDEKPEDEKPEDEPKEDERDARIAELEAQLAEKDAKIAELEAKVKELEEMAGKPVEEPVKMNKINIEGKSSGALKYFEK